MHLHVHVCMCMHSVLFDVQVYGAIAYKLQVTENRRL